MEDLHLIIGRLIGIVVLTLHDFIHYRVNYLLRRQSRPVQGRRRALAPWQARSPARRKRALPYTGATQRLNEVGALPHATARTSPALDLRTLSPSDLWREVLQRSEGDKKAAAKFLAAALTHGSKT